MRVKLLPLLPLLLLTSMAYAETCTYLVYRKDNFPQDRYLYMVSPQEYKLFADTGKKSIDDAGGQPFRLTSYEINYSGAYALWTVTYADNDEKWHIDSMEKQGYIVLLSSIDVVSVDYGPHGKVQEAISSYLMSLPTDYYQVSTNTL